MKSKLIVANWKTNPLSEKEAVRLAQAEDNENAIICPPFIFLSAVKKNLKHAQLGAQDVFWEKSGPYTGEISTDMLKNSGVKFVIVGHSKRRTLGETDEIVSKKASACLKSGLVPIVCIGERERDNGHTYLNFIKQQLKSSLVGVPRALAGKVVVAYEPVWAIGRKAARAATSEECGEMVIFIRKILSDIFSVQSAARARILYGGSVEPQNVNAYLTAGADGLLVGHDSLDPKKFGEILKVAQSM